MSVRLVPIDWDKAAGDHLDGVGDLEASDYRLMYERNRVNVFAIEAEGNRIGTLLMKWETVKVSGSLVGVIVAAAGQGQTDLVQACIPECERLARKVRAVGLRLHTERPGMVRKMAQFAGDRELMIGWRL